MVEHTGCRALIVADNHADEVADFKRRLPSLEHLMVRDQGAVKDAAGGLTGDSKLQAEGKLDMAKGAVHKARRRREGCRQLCRGNAHVRRIASAPSVRIPHGPAKIAERLARQRQLPKISICSKIADFFHTPLS
jgi:hypothetical protein